MNAQNMLNYRRLELVIQSLDFSHYQQEMKAFYIIQTDIRQLAKHHKY